MNIESVQYEPVDSDLLPGKALRITILGTGLEQRAVSIAAQVGQQPVLSLMPLSSAEGVQGFLAQEPNDGDELLIGFFDDEELQATGFKYSPNVS